MIKVIEGDYFEVHDEEENAGSILENQVLALEVLSPPCLGVATMIHQH